MPATSADLSPPMNHVFLDYENVHEVDVSFIGRKSVSFTLLLGAKQTKLDAALVERLMERAASVQLIRLTKSGKNALDFALVYYLGRAVLADPTGYFHIVSKDTDFDSLIEHLRSRHIQVHRHRNWTTLTLSAPAKSPPAAQNEALTGVLEQLRKHSTNKPKKKKKLLSLLKSKLGKEATDDAAEMMLAQLIKREHLTLDDKGAVSYRL